MTMDLLRFALPYYEPRTWELYRTDPIYRRGIDEWRRLAGVDLETIIRGDLGDRVEIPAYYLLGWWYDEEMLKTVIEGKPIYLTETGWNEDKYIDMLEDELEHRYQRLEREKRREELQYA